MAEVKEIEIPFSHCTFEAEDPESMKLTEMNDIKSMTLGVKRMTLPLFPRGTFRQWEGLGLRFTELEKTAEGKSRGVLFFVDHPRALDHLITELMELRNQLYGPPLNNEN